MWGEGLTLFLQFVQSIRHMMNASRASLHSQSLASEAAGSKETTPLLGTASKTQRSTKPSDGRVRVAKLWRRVTGEPKPELVQSTLGTLAEMGDDERSAFVVSRLLLPKSSQLLMHRLPWRWLILTAFHRDVLHTGMLDQTSPLCPRGPRSSFNIFFGPWMQALSVPTLTPSSH